MCFFHSGIFAIQVWDFKGRDLKSRFEVGCAVVKIVYHRSNGAAHMLNFGSSLPCISFILCYFSEVSFDVIFRSFSYCS